MDLKIKDVSADCIRRQAFILFQSGLEEEEAEQNTVRDAAALLDCELFMSHSCVSEARQES